MTPSYTWIITKPDSSTVSGSGAVATIAADEPGTYSCTFTAAASRECPPPEITLTKTKAVQFTATLSVNPSVIKANTSWLEMPIGNNSDINVTWDPPECVGTLEIAEVDTSAGYQPPDDGVLEKVRDDLWIYTPYDEPQTELCSKNVKIWIAVKQGNTELIRKNILVLPIHTFLTTGPNADYQMTYDYIRWKYAAVMATTGGSFTGGETFSTEVCVPCPRFLFDPLPPCVAACTNIETDHVDFGTQAFANSENASASTIGHELVHTTDAGESECAAYTWEVNHSVQTGISTCDNEYLIDIQNKQNSECP